MIQKTNAVYSEVHTYIGSIQKPSNFVSNDLGHSDSALLSLDATNIENDYFQRKG